MLRKTALCVTIAAAALAQESAPSGLLKGTLLTWSGSGTGGAFTFLGSENRVYSCSYDQKTYMERDNQRITFSRTEKGDRMEIVSDRRPGSSLCYARTVHIIDPPQTHLVPGVRPRPKDAPSMSPLTHHGNLTFSGVVLRVTQDFLVLKSRNGEHQTIRLRSDTRFLAEGQISSSGNLRANTKVFVQAGKNLDNEVEAYQVVWGEILQPEE